MPAAKPKRKTNPGAKAKRKANPFVARATTRQNGKRNPPPRRNPKARRRNPEGMPGNAIELLKEGGIVMLGLVGARQIPQMVLAEKNTGWLGYFGNAATTAVLAFGASKAINPRAGYFCALGGVAYLVNRILTEKVSPIGQYLALSGVGDHAAITSLGDIQDTYFPYPAVFDGQGNPVIPQEILNAARAAVPQASSGQIVPLAGNPYGSPYLATAYNR